MEWRYEDKIVRAWSLSGIISIVFGYIGGCVSSDYKIAGYKYIDIVNWYVKNKKLQELKVKDKIYIKDYNLISSMSILNKQWCIKH